MIEINSLIGTGSACQKCGTPITITAWHMPGNRFIAEGACKYCNMEVLQDLPYSFGLTKGCTLNKETGETYGPDASTEPGKESFYSRELRWMFQTRDSDRKCSYEEYVAKQPNSNEVIILECIDPCYGHGIHALLNAQYHLDHHPEKDLLVVVPKFLAWLVPDDVERVIIVDLPLREAYQWLDSLNQRVKEITSEYKHAYISDTFIAPHPNDFDISRFVPEVKPFDPTELGETEAPTITYITRENKRLWVRGPCADIFRKLWKRWDSPLMRRIANWYQRHAIVQLERRLRHFFPDMTFTVVGVGASGSFPSRIRDARKDSKDMSETVEIDWCRQYAKSHVVVGMHGSNMLLPSALAGSTVEVAHMRDKANNIVQDWLPTETDPRMALFRYRFLPSDISIDSLARVVRSIPVTHPTFHTNMVTHTYYYST